MRIRSTKFFILPIAALAILFGGIQSEGSLANTIIMTSTGVCLSIASVLYYYRMYVVLVKKSTMSSSYENILIIIGVVLIVISFFIV